MGLWLWMRTVGKINELDNNWAMLNEKTISDLPGVVFPNSFEFKSADTHPPYAHQHNHVSKKIKSIKEISAEY